MYKKRATLIFSNRNGTPEQRTYIIDTEGLSNSEVKKKSLREICVP